MLSTIRIARPSDAPELALLQGEVWRSAHPDLLDAEALSWWPASQRIASWELWLSDARPAAVTLVAHCPEGLLGLCRVGRCKDPSAGDDWGSVHGLTVDPAARGYGIGRQLLGAGLEELQALGRREVTTWVLESDERARRFWRRAGFLPDGLAFGRPDLGCQELRLVRVRPLPDAP